jgi:catechol 2,3-dioxygenase-like lactoylglutathione lyase family enzyme
MLKLKPHHIALKVQDLQRCEAFYREILGLRLITRHLDPEGKLRSVWLDLDGVILMLERYEGATAEGPAGCQDLGNMPETGGWHLLALSIPASARASWKEKLARQGIPVVRESAYSIYFLDPEKNNLALSHYPEPV